MRDADMLKMTQAQIDEIANRTEFATEDEAWDTVAAAHMDDPFADNHRLAYLDDPEQVAKYEQQEREGCCGFVDLEVTIAGRPALIGCNYGH